jgi:3-oxoacyl-[acyl-carrier-protein] synthase I
MSAAHIVALAARTPVGLSAETAAAAVRARVSRLQAHPFLTDPAGERIRVGLDPLLPAVEAGPGRLAAMAAAAVAEVLRKLPGRRIPRPLRLFLAVPEPRPGHTSEDSEQVARALARQASPGGTIEVVRHGEGHAGCLAALEAAAGELARGRAELCLVVGVDSYLGYGTTRWLLDERRLAHKGVRSGLAPGEGAGAVALSNDRLRGHLGLPSLARLLGVATALETGHPGADEGLLGHGLTEVVRRACAADPDRAPIDGLYGDINGERHRSDDWGFAALREGARFRDPSDHQSAVGEWGDVGAATGALGCVLAAEAWRHDKARGPRALVWGGSWGGLRGAALLAGGDT